MHGVTPRRPPVARWIAPLCLALVSVGVTSAAAALRSSAFLAYGTQGEDRILTDGARLEKISVFAYHITADGDVLPPNSWVPDVLDRLMAEPHGHTILVTVNNRVLGPDGKPAPFHSGDTVQAILADPAKRAEHLRQLVALSVHADGIELNYENLPPESRPYFTDFIRDLRKAMPKERKLSIVLQPKTTNATGDRGRAVDWRAIEPYADYLRIMAYYYSYSTSPPGPVVPVETLRALGAYAVNDAEQSIPTRKLSVILSLWGWDWPLAGGTPGRLIEFSEAMDLATSHSVTPERDATEGSLHFQYTAPDGVVHEVWIDDAQSLQSRVEVLQAAGVPRVDFWNINTGDPNAWAYIRANAVRPRAAMDFDGDGRSDFALFRASAQRYFFDWTHEGGTDLALSFGQQGDIPVPADYDGDGRTDLAVFRPSNARWLVDLDHDGEIDLDVAFGSPGDVPVPADYDGDGAADLAVFTPSTARWQIDPARRGIASIELIYGAAGDVPVPQDYDGNGTSDVAVFRPSTARWLIDWSREGGTDIALTYGKPGDIPVPGDYDGDGHADLAVFRNGRWWIDGNLNGGTDRMIAFGRPGDVPVPGDYDGDGRIDLAVYRPQGSGWFVDSTDDGTTDVRVRYGATNDVPLRANGAALNAAATPPESSAAGGTPPPTASTLP